PGAKLSGDVARAQTQQSRDARLHPGQRRTVAAPASRNLPRGIAVLDQGLTMLEDFRADIAWSICPEGRTLAREIISDLLQIRVGQKFQQIVHRRISPPSVLEREELIVEVPGWFPGQAREIDVAGAFAPIAVAGRTGLHPSCHGVRRLAGRLSGTG